MDAITRYYVGVERTGDGRSILPADAKDRMRQATERLARMFGGVTVIPAAGGWINRSDKLVVEKSLIFEIIGQITPDQQMAVQTYLVSLFEQESVLLLAA